MSVSPKGSKDGPTPGRRLAALAKTVAMATAATKSSIASGKVIYPRPPRGPPLPCLSGGEALSTSEENALQQLVFGRLPPRLEWTTSPLRMHPPESKMAYGVVVPPGTPPALKLMAMVIQAQLLRCLLFQSTEETPAGEEDSEVLQPSAAKQKEVLSSAVAHIIWHAGQSQRCTLVMGITPDDESEGSEKLYAFLFESLEETQTHLHRYLHMFQKKDGPGYLLLLYSALLSRGLDSVNEDLGPTSNLTSGGREATLALAGLLLTGRLSHTFYEGVNGVSGRAEVGLLLHDSKNLEESSGHVAARLRTPALPIWLGLDPSTGASAVVFSTRRHLLRHHRAENCFQMLFYTSGRSETENADQTILTVDTRSEQRTFKEFDDDDGDGNREPLLVEQFIQSRWPDARVTWEGPFPFL